MSRKRKLRELYAVARSAEPVALPAVDAVPGHDEASYLDANDIARYVAILLRFGPVGAPYFVRGADARSSAAGASSTRPPFRRDDTMPSAPRLA